MSDVPHIQRLCEPYVGRRILLGKDHVTLYGGVQEFQIAVGPDGVPIGCGALHVIWDDLAEVRTLALDAEWIRHGSRPQPPRVARRRRPALEIGRIFCLTFEVDFFDEARLPRDRREGLVSPDVYAELVRSTDEGVAEFLDLARVKPNTLGNTRMLKAAARGLMLAVDARGLTLAVLTARSPRILRSTRRAGPSNRRRPHLTCAHVDVQEPGRSRSRPRCTGVGEPCWPRVFSWSCSSSS